MAWLAAAIFGIGVLYFAINNSGFRKIVYGLFIVIVVTALLGAGYLYWNNQRQLAQTAYAKTLIKPWDVDFFDLTMSSSYGSHTVQGKIRNRSRYPIRSFEMHITVNDCPSGKCEVIGEGSLTEWSIDVPPHQVRSFTAYVSLPDIPTPSAMQWNYAVTEIEASLN